MTARQTQRATAVLQRLPVATLGIIALNVAVTILTYRNQTFYADCYVQAYGLIPRALRPGSLITATFLHDGYVHLGLNMLFLYIFGSAVERSMGRLEYVIFYIGACFASSLVHVGIVLGTLPPEFETRPMVGASGAIAGVMGIYAVRFHRRMFRFAGVEIPALLMVMGWLMLQIALGVLGLYRDSILGLGLKQVGYWSHLGGFGFGIAVALMANMALQGEREYLVSQAKKHESEDNLLEAVRNHETLLKHDPDNAHSHAELGRLWALLEERDESLRNYQIGVELFIAQGREDRATEAAEEMERFWPHTTLPAATRFRLASYLEEAGDPAHATRVFHGIVEEDPQSAEAQMSLLKIAQLQMSSSQGRAVAVETLSDFLHRYPDSEWRSFAEEALTRARADE